MIHGNRKRRAAAGAFTLIEVLLSMGIGILIMTSVLSSLDYTQRAVDAIHNVIETETAGPRVMQLIREDLSRLAVYDVREYRLYQGKNLSEGPNDADRFDFVAYRRSTRPFHDFVREESVWAPLVEVGYRLRRNPQLYDFLELYRREDFLQDEEPFKDGEFTLLYDRVLNFDVRYAARPESDIRWEDEWDSEEREGLFFAMEIRLEIEVQPRRSKESLGILGANRARLTFEDVYAVPEDIRWVMRNRIHPYLPGADEAGTGDGGGDAAQEGDGPNVIGGGGGGGLGRGGAGGDRRGGRTDRGGGDGSGGGGGP
ncbi:MAG TPA: hypothetical protein VGC54_08595 [Planctomycetota bacterium]